MATTRPGPVSQASTGFVEQLFAPLPSRYDRLSELLSFGQDRRWRSEMVAAIARAGPARVLDVAAGTAKVSVDLARRTAATVIGIDLSGDMIARAARSVSARGLEGRIALVNGRAEALPFANASFDAVTFTYLLRYVDDPQATLAELARVVRPGGRMASLEFFVPPRAPWHAAWWLYTRAVLPLAGLVTGGAGWWRVGRFLGPSISSHYRRMPLVALVEAWQRAGFIDVAVRVMSLGGGVVTSGTRAGG